MDENKLTSLQGLDVPAPTPKIWDDLRLFSIASSLGSFAKAADFTRINAVTISRRLQHLEDVLGAELFRSGSTGLVATEVGRSILQEIEGIESHVRVIERLAQGKAKGLTKTVRIAVSDGFAQYVLTPELPKLREMAPNVSVAMLSSHQAADLSRNQADVSIGFQPYDSNEILNSKVGLLKMKPFATPAYLEANGTPKSLQDLENFTLIDHLAYGLDEADWSLWQAAEREHAPYKANLSAVHYEMVVAGMGIGMLPDYAVTKGQVVPIEIGYELNMQIYLSFPRSNQTRKEIKTVRAWLDWVFKDQHGQWFGHET